MLQLFGAPQCRRYQRMRAQALQACARVAGCQLEEVNDTERLAQHNPLDLPLLVWQGEVIFRRNPPTADEIVARLQRNGEET